MQNNAVGNVSATALGTFEIFRMLDIETREKIACGLQTRHVEKGHFIISARSKDTDVFFLISGKIRACSINQSGKQIHFDEIQSGMMFGELSAIDGLQRSADCISTEKCHLAVMNSDEFNKILKQYSQVQHAVLLRLARMARGQMQKIYEFSALSVSQRIHCELLRLASGAIPNDSGLVLDSAPTHAEIASRVSTHREAVTREIKALEASGLITWKKNNYIIHDIAKLSELNLVSATG